MTAEVLRTPYSRLFLIEDGAAPNITPDYMGLARVSANSFKQGTLTPVRKPSPDVYGAFEIIDMIQGAPDLPQMTVESRMRPVISDLLRIVNKGCAVDLQVHFGTCQNPSDFDGGWAFIRVLELGRPSDYGVDSLGAIDADQNAVVTETVPFSGERIFDIKHVRPSEVAGAQLTDIVNRVLICDSKTCGACGISSDGCQIMFAVTGTVTGSPGLPPELLYSQDGGATWATTNIATMGIAEVATDMACVGVNLVVISTTGTAGNYHYAKIADILTGTATWTKVTTGFVATFTPTRIVSIGPAYTWIVGTGGYIYFMADVSSGVTVQSAGTVTAQNLLGVHAYDFNNIVAVGASNVVLNSANGGASWTLITGPSVGVSLNTVWMQSAARWLIGNAGGNLYYTLNNGLTWVNKIFSGTAAGQIRDIQFASRSVGYMLHDTATPRGRVLRTINGGYSWVVVPDETGIPVPTTTSLRAVAACVDNPNVALVGGTHSNGTDGYLAVYS